MQPLARAWTILSLMIAIGLTSIVPTHVAQAQALPQDSVPWGGVYYPNPNFEDPLWRVEYNGLMLNFGLGAPTDPVFLVALPGLPVDDFSARFSANTPFDAGIYEFTILADGGVRMEVNNNVIIDDIGNTGIRTFTGLAFVGSGPTSLVVDYVDYSGNAILEVRWEEVSEREFGTSDTDEIGIIDFELPTTVTGQVNGVNGLALRSGPYLGASLIAVLRPGIIYEVVAQNNIEGDFTWYKVIVNAQGQTGWASGRYFDVNFGNITTSNCASPTTGALNLAQTLVPGFSEANIATQCFNAVAEVLNANPASDFSPAELLDVALSCTAFGLGPTTSPTTIRNLINTTKLVFDIYNICTSGSCTLTQELTLEISALIANRTGLTVVGSTLEVVLCLNAIAALVNVSNATINSVVLNCGALIVLDGTRTVEQTIFDFINSIGANICETSSIPTLSVPEEGSIFDDLTLLPDTGVTVAPRSTMNIRVRPSTRTAEVGDLPWGAEAQLLARTIEAGVDHWYLVRYQGIIGWIDASFSNVSGNINDVPIY